MLRTVWAKTEGRRRLYLIDERCDFIEPVKLYLDHLAALEKCTQADILLMRAVLKIDGEAVLISSHSIGYRL